MKENLLISVIISSLVIVALPAKAVETRCGWLYNPTPANWYLIDKDGRWIISQQGGYEAKGMDDNLPTNEKEYVKTNGYYGYGCACMDVVTDKERSRISEIRGGESLPLSTCREDPTLPKSPS
ncbi:MULTISPECIES: DUF4087 domain-containing protein [unclassified Microcoleus]|uniref:DUF4087 domain-containing protein n=1 Tax=unclassified Microcoleus TaxID=2642155 RepID=UPI002FD5DEDF